MLEIQNVPPRLSSLTDEFRIQRVWGAARRLAFQLSKDGFAAAFGAQIADDTEEFYAVIDRSGQQVAAFGLNRQVGHMACAQYLSEQDVSLAVRSQLPQFNANLRLVELCHLGLVSGRVFCQLLPILASFLAQHADVLICTATSQLAKHFVQRGFAPYRVAQAEVEHLPLSDRSRWGTYYQTKPQVLVGDLAQASMPSEVADVA